MLTIYSCSLIALTISSFLLWSYGDSGGSFTHAIASFIGFVGGTFTVFMSVVSIVMCFSWFSAEHSANIINREYGTNYTQEEIFLC